MQTAMSLEMVVVPNTGKICVDSSLSPSFFIFMLEFSVLNSNIYINTCVALKCVVVKYTSSLTDCFFPPCI